jgi:hypothetical protein
MGVSTDAIVENRCPPCCDDEIEVINTSLPIELQLLEKLLHLILAFSSNILANKAINKSFRRCHNGTLLGRKTELLQGD